MLAASIPSLPSASGSATPDPGVVGRLLAVRDLHISFSAGRGNGREQEVVRGVSLDIRRGEIHGLVGESGSGKSLTALALVGLTPAGARVRGSVRLEAPEGELELVGLAPKLLRQVRGGRIGFVFQEPMTAFNPLLTIGFQLSEAVRAHRPLGRREARAEAIRLLERVAIPDPARRIHDHPRHLSGGQRQRAIIALALAGGPDLLLADEPTTSLDLTLQAQVLDLLLRLRDEEGLAILLITHDLGVVAETCDRLAVMYRGEIVERDEVEEVFRNPRHPHTLALLSVLPRHQLGGGAA